MPACAVVTETDIALYLRGKEGNRTTYSEERTEDLEKYGILVVGQDQDRPGTLNLLRVFKKLPPRRRLRLQAEFLWPSFSVGDHGPRP